MLLDFARSLGAAPDKPWSKLKAAHRRELLYGRKGRYVGIFPFLKDLEEKRYKQYIRVFLRQYQLAKTCGDCGGTRLNPDALAVRIGGETIAEVAARSVDGIHAWLGSLDLTPFEREVAHLILEQLDARLGFLRDVGLGYLSLDRQTRTLSGGEAQRISLSNALGARLVDTLYVLDEPSVGLHPRDTDRLLALLRRLRDGGNTVIVVEHDLAAIQQADFMLELGPGSGERGGRVVHAGPVATASQSLTGTVSHRAEADRGAQPAASGGAALAQGARRHAAQPARRGRGHPPRRAHRGHRRLRFRQEHPAPRRDLPATSRRSCTAGTPPSPTWAKRSARSSRSRAGSS